MKKLILAASLALLGGVAQAETIAVIEDDKRVVHFFEDRIGCPKGLKTVGVWNKVENRVTLTGCWFYEPLNKGSEITVNFHAANQLLYLPVSVLKTVPDFRNRALAH
ncbi:hypothetical protein RU58_00029 [Achromobacter phage phiAxp-1]|uniref:hypothetical protein n=1 Tax=Achromobacter phage phiAxp-1 TaxID=1610509 RepID=UPI0006563C7F|nr:hypothetical protein RU58_00029 [Achromobacter phage phiAxp-1]AKJ71418.1 hypothetical protein RU58_00029 [Achromobacter phage phiAxp-1]QDH84393.1 hypothetical protein Axy18_028 [Achromobacter phage vB_AxyS_19-32_Axy18]QDH84520.1 hypothetical protein Axy20_029 [Achromobacter phage vB_AxyS_19-32_Axy20]